MEVEGIPHDAPFREADFPEAFDGMGDFNIVKSAFDVKGDANGVIIAVYGGFYIVYGVRESCVTRVTWSERMLVFAKRFLLEDSIFQVPLDDSFK